MKEIGGYFGFEEFAGNEYHSDCLALNTGRNCLRYLIHAKGIKKIAIPKYNCSAVVDVCRQENLDIKWYNINKDLQPIDIDRFDEDTFLYVINYYGQLSNDYLASLYKNKQKLILDYSQSFFRAPLPGADTLYTCRKYFGVPDGAYLYTQSKTADDLETEKSTTNAKHLIGRLEDSASSYYEDYKRNEDYLSEQPIRKMSALSHDILKAVDYESVKKKRNHNFSFLNDKLKNYNQLTINEIEDGPFMYPLLLDNGEQIRGKLNKIGIYVPCLWKEVTDITDSDEFEHGLALNLLPLPCDQRYNEEDMSYIVETIIKRMEEKK